MTPDLNNSPRAQHIVFFITRTHHTILVYRIGSVIWGITTGRVRALRTEVGFIISPSRTPRTKWEHTVGPIDGVISTKRKARHVGAVVSQVCQVTR